MKKRSYQVMIAALILTSLLFLTMFIIEKKSEAKYEKVWNLALTDAIFCLEQYQAGKGEEGYTYAIGDIGTLANVFINIKENTRIETSTQSFAGFYECFVTKQETMKDNIPEILVILDLLKQEDESAYQKMNELMYKIL